MSEYETVAVPFQTKGNQQFLSRQQVEELPWLADFMERFPLCFEADPMSDIFWFFPDATSPQPLKLRRLRHS